MQEKIIQISASGGDNALTDFNTVTVLTSQGRLFWGYHTLLPAADDEEESPQTQVTTVWNELKLPPLHD